MPGPDLLGPLHTLLSDMDFPERLAAIRRERGMTQQTLADHVGVHVVQIRRYEAGKSQPTLDVLRHMATTLAISADLLLFDKDERGPDEDLRLQFEAASRLSPEEKQVIRTVIEGIIVNHEVKRLASAPSATDLFPSAASA